MEGKEVKATQILASKAIKRAFNIIEAILGIV